ncbi:hypothetical protein O6P37_01890 [Mycobacterium sp. CPCC 205372]|uniref:DUF732 domain-containing protein n=1 Tax=Mycobacterium hippophais TaxID=3016340 RepID=A0ABT4PM15_9MYCO|nr:hypothetical protein [Mycobacterium hippophais]MCZ8377607.1 hypothetical protein [Mycobacterium hippophais]
MNAKTALGAAALAACGVLAVPAGLATADETALDTINRYQDAGYTVNIDRIGSAPLEQCTVTGIRNPQEVRRLVRDNGQYRWWEDDEDHRGYVEVISRSISVSLNCSR